MKKFEMSVNVTPEMLSQTIMTDEMLKRDLIDQLVRSIPIEDLESIFHIEKFDPSDNVLIKKAEDTRDFSLQQLLARLRDTDMLSYKVSVTSYRTDTADMSVKKKLKLCDNCGDRADGKVHLNLCRRCEARSGHVIF